MKQIVPFSRELKFNTRLYEITSISLEHSLRASEDRDISGEFLLSGEYKMSDISVNKELFNFNIPFNIELDSRYNTNNVYIDVDDFHYDIVDEDTLRVDIDVLIDGLEILEEQPVVEEQREDVVLENNEESKDDGKEEDNIDESNEERDDKTMDLFKEVNPKVVPVEADTNVGSIFDSISEEEKFTTYHVHIVREDDNIDSICSKYNVTKDELSDYNDISVINIGDKIIVPTKNETSK